MFSSVLGVAGYHAVWLSRLLSQSVCLMDRLGRMMCLRTSRNQSPWRQKGVTIGWLVKGRA